MGYSRHFSFFLILYFESFDYSCLALTWNYFLTLSRSSRSFSLWENFQEEKIQEIPILIIQFTFFNGNDNQKKSTIRISNRSPIIFCVGIDGIERTSERKAEPPSEVSAILQKFPLTWALSHLSFARRPNSMKEWKLRVTCTNNKCVWWSDWMKYFRGPSAGVPSLLWLLLLLFA